MSQSIESNHQFDITIVGGGMVGISLALLAQQKRWKVLVLESQPINQGETPQYSPSFDARSTALSWSSVAVFSKKWGYGRKFISRLKLFRLFM